MSFGIWIFLFSGAVHAADGIDAHGFRLAAFDGDPRSPLMIHRPGRFSAGDAFIGGVFEYASKPLVYVLPRPDGTVEETPIVDNLLAINLSGGVAPLSWLRFDVSAPLFLSSIGQDGEPQGAGLGDLRVTAEGQILSPEEEAGLSLAVMPFIDVPTGSPEKYLGQPGIAGGGDVSASYLLDRWTVTGDVGVLFQPTTELENIQNADSLNLGLGGGYLLSETLGVNLEAHFGLPFEKSTVTGTGMPSEAILSLRSRVPSGFQWTTGIAVPLSRGVGAAQYRFFLGGGWGKVNGRVAKVVDTDGDGLSDPVDQCPTEPETFNQYKEEDGCPDQLATLLVRVERNGKPVALADLNITGGTDPVNAKSSAEAPVRLENLMPGSNWTALASQGTCLAGTAAMTVAEGENNLVVTVEPRRDAAVVVDVVNAKGRPISDAVLTWEKEPTGCVAHEPLKLGDDGTGRQNVGVGKHTLYVTAPGYNTWSGEVDPKAGEEVPVHVVLRPTKVRLEDSRLVILEKVYFDTASASIQQRSYDLLDEVANTLRSHPEIKKVEVAGYTDSDGNDAYNLDLSQRRVDSVRAYLLHRGVSDSQLVSKGYGESDPVSPNTSAANKANNRRVEFHILERDKVEVEVEPMPQSPPVAPPPAEPPARILPEGK